MTEDSIVRENLMTEIGYRPYCGNNHCRLSMPRANWSSTHNQFTCSCGWVSEFPPDFIARYKAKWNK